MKNKSIEDYTWWCQLMGLNPSHARNIDRYQKLCDRMSKPKWEGKAKYPNGQEKTYIICSLDIDNLQNVLMIAEEEEIHLKIYSISYTGERRLLYDGLFLQLANEVENENV